MGITAVVVIAVVGSYYDVLGLYPESYINRLDVYMDLETGRYKYEKYVFWVNVYSRVKETTLSRLRVKFLGEVYQPQWAMLCSITPNMQCGVSDHTHSQGAGYVLTSALGIGNFTNDAKKTVMTNFFSLLKGDDNPIRATQYADSLFILATSRKDNMSIERDQLPVIPLH
ncbi:MAG: hypothetical protein HY606_01805 [Planctomycetes bacterium]|nr:hypothetical protein [Planctomycetota bacterium]